MTRFAIDRKNRDRKGGHECTPLRKGPWAGADMKKARALIKRADKRAMRRLHNKAIAAGIAQHYQEMNDLADLHAGWDIDDDYDYQEYLHGHEEEDPYDDYPDDLDSHLFDDGPYYGMDDHDEYPRHRSNARIQDQDTALDLAQQVLGGMVSLDLEVIENRDAGKSLGQLLRERLSRPF